MNPKNQKKDIPYHYSQLGTREVLPYVEKGTSVIIGSNVWQEYECFFCHDSYERIFYDDPKKLGEMYEWMGLGRGNGCFGNCVNEGKLLFCNRIILTPNKETSDVRCRMEKNVILDESYDYTPDNNTFYDFSGKKMCEKCKSVTELDMSESSQESDFEIFSDKIDDISKFFNFILFDELTQRIKKLDLSNPQGNKKKNIEIQERIKYWKTKEIPLVVGEVQKLMTKRIPLTLPPKHAKTFIECVTNAYVSLKIYPLFPQEVKDQIRYGKH